MYPENPTRFFRILHSRVLRLHTATSFYLAFPTDFLSLYVRSRLFSYFAQGKEALEALNTSPTVPEVSTYLQPHFLAPYVYIHGKMSTSTHAYNT